MLVNTRSDTEFQAYCDTEEQRLYVALWPILAAGVRLQVNTNAVQASDYVEARGGPVLTAHYERIYRDQYNAVSEQADLILKAAGVSDFLIEQSRNLLRLGAQKIVGIAETLRKVINDLMLAGVAEGKSNARIAREIIAKAPGIAQARAATIARTETHNSALDAIDASLAYKKIKVKRKTWWTAQDRRVRQSHVEVHDTTVDYDQPFDVGGVQMMRPGDQSLGAGAEEVVNCRCAILYKTEERLRQSSASDLYQPPTKTPEQIIMEHGAADGVQAARDKLRKGIPTNALVQDGGFKLADGNYTADRRALHEKIVDEFLSDEAVLRARPASGEQPTLTVLGGRGGSGKSWITKQGPVDGKRTIILDSDEIKAELPGYAGWNAALYHEESSDIADMIDQRASALGVNMVLDATLRSRTGVNKRIAMYEKAGYKLEGFYMYLSPDDAASRALARFSKGGKFTGRFVPPEVILENTENEKNFDALSPKFLRWAVYENSGTAPRLVQQGGH